MRWFLMMAAAGMALQAAPVRACLSEPLSEAVLFDAPPAHRPPSHAAVKVVATIVDGDGERLLVRIVDPDLARRLGPTAWLQAPMSSCTSWGRIGAEAYAVARVAGKLRGRMILSAAAYRRSWLDSIRGWFGWETYQASGEPL